MNDLHDYNVELNEKSLAMGLDIKHRLNSFMRGTKTAFELRIKNGSEGNFQGLYIAGCPLDINALTGIINKIIAARQGYKIIELTRDPVTLREEIYEAETKISKLERLVKKAAIKQIEAEEELKMWIDGIEREEGYESLVKFIVGEIARVSGVDNYPQGILQDPDKLKTYIVNFLEQVPSGIIKKPDLEVIKEKDLVTSVDLSKYLNQLETIKLLFKLSNNSMGIESVVDFCTRRLEEELGWRTFSEYDNLGFIKTVSGILYEASKIVNFIKGEKEAIFSSSGENRTVHRQHVIYVNSPEFALFFRDGVYHEEDAIVKYGLSKKQLMAYSFDRSNRSRVSLLEKLDLETRTGPGIFYKREELDAIIK